MTDQRARTSRTNLEPHIPRALSPHGTTVITVRLPTPLADQLKLEATTRGTTLSEIIRERLV